jgi:hypothetical protein
MGLLVVSAAASPIFRNFLFAVSVIDTDGKPVAGLKAASFKVHHLASLNHAGANPRTVDKVTEAPEGCYIVTLKPSTTQPNLPPGHYVFAVRVIRTRKRGEPADMAAQGQVIAWGDLPP